MMHLLVRINDFVRYSVLSLQLSEASAGRNPAGAATSEGSGKRPVCLGEA